MKSVHCRRWRCRRPGCECRCKACAKIKNEALAKQVQKVDEAFTRMMDDAAMGQGPWGRCS